MLSAEAQAKRHQTWVRQTVGAGVPLGHGTQAGPCGAEPGPTVAHSVTVRTASASTRSKPRLPLFPSLSRYYFLLRLQADLGEADRKVGSRF